MSVGAVPGVMAEPFPLAARPWSSGAAAPGGELARVGEGVSRSFLEESDDLRASGRDRLWPYCVRLKQSPVQRVLAERN